MKRSPWVIGPWVRAERFYGRDAELQRLLAAAAPATRLVGLRRIGKTSLLRELETRIGEDPGILPLYWDLEDVDDPTDLGSSLFDALEDAEPHLQARGVPVETFTERRIAPLLQELASTLVVRGLGLFLLLDETERLSRLDPSTRELLHQGLRRCRGLRLIAGSSPLWRPGAELLPDLDGDAPIVRLGALDRPAAESLVRQDRLPPPQRPELPPDLPAAVVERSGGHPYLTQLLAKRAVEAGDVDRAVRELATDRALDLLHRVDLSLLTERERAELGSRAKGSADSGDPDTAERLAALGLLRATTPGKLEIGNVFLAHWLRTVS